MKRHSVFEKWFGVAQATRLPQPGSGREHGLQANAFRKFQSRIPKGFRPEAQGCEE